LARVGATYITVNDTFYCYTERGYWVRQDDRKVYKLIGHQCRKAYKVRRDAKGLAREVTYPFAKDGSMKSAFNFSRSLLDHTSDLPYNSHLMCFQNGVVDARTGELQPHDRAHFLTSAITTSYVKGAQCPEGFDRLLPQRLVRTY
jgi:phage/plasmid-associated DNA primase